MAQPLFLSSAEHPMEKVRFVPLQNDEKDHFLDLMEFS